MKLTSWSATASGRAVIITGTNDEGDVITLDDVAEIVNDVRAGTTIAVRKKPKPGVDGQRVRLS